MSSSYNGETELEAAERRIRSLPKCGAAKLARMEDTFRNLLEAIGESPQREGLLRTPLRAALAFEFLTNGYRQNLDEIVNGAIFRSERDHSGEGHRTLLDVRTSFVAIYRPRARRIYPKRKSHRPFQNRAHCRCFRAAAANSGTAHGSNCGRADELPAAKRCWRCGRGKASVHDDAGSRKAELRNENLLLARLIQGRRAHPLGISLAAKRVVAQASGLWRRMRACRVHIRAADSLATSQARCLTFGVVQL